MSGQKSAVKETKQRGRSRKDSSVEVVREAGNEETLVKQDKSSKGEKPEKNEKQQKIDIMLTQGTTIENPSLADVMATISAMDKKMSKLVSKEYIDSCLKGVVSEKFVQEGFEKLKNELVDGIKKDLDNVYGSLNKVKAKVLSAENEIDDLKSAQSDIRVNMDKINEERSKMKKEFDELKERFSEREKRMQQHEFILNEHEQYSRLNNLRIYGLQDDNKMESALETANLVIKTLKDKLRLDIMSRDIDVAHRLGKFSAEGNRPVICRFVHRILKKKVLSVRRNLKGTSIVIREDLTAKNAKTLETASSKEEVSNAWSDEGRIIVQLLNGKKLRVDLYTDLSKPLIPKEELLPLLAARRAAKNAAVKNK